MDFFDCIYFYEMVVVVGIGVGWVGDEGFVGYFVLEVVEYVVFGDNDDFFCGLFFGEFYY